MYKIVKKERLTPTLTKIEIEAPFIARKAEPGQFIILRVDEEGERIPITVHDFNREKGTVTIIYQICGATTVKLDQIEEGGYIHDFVGPLGKETECEGVGKVAVIGGGVGTAIAYPVAKKMHDLGNEVDMIVGFRNKDLIILENEFRNACTNLYIGTDDGSNGKKANATQILEERIAAGDKYDMVFCVGPLRMMKSVCDATKKYNLKTIISMSPLMVDGTGMCGCCRLTVGGETKFACVDGPDFDGALVNFDEAIARGTTYNEFERNAYEEACNLYKKGGNK